MNAISLIDSALLFTQNERYRYWHRTQVIYQLLIWILDNTVVKFTWANKNKNEPRNSS